MPVACGQGIRSKCCYFFVCFKLFDFLCSVGNEIYFLICIQNYLFYSAMSSQPTGVGYKFFHVVN